MNIADLKALIRAMGEAPVSEFEYSDGEVRVRIVGQGMPPSPGEIEVPVSDASTGTSAASHGANGGEAHDVRHVAVAPLPGLFYRAPAPQDPPFVEPGTAVTAGQTLGLIEAMKMLTPVKAEAAGVIVRVLVNNGASVETGTPLFEIE